MKTGLIWNKTLHFAEIDFRQFGPITLSAIRVSAIRVSAIRVDTGLLNDECWLILFFNSLNIILKLINPPSPETIL